MKGIIGRKLGMTQIFNEDGTCVPVTVVQAGPCTVIRKKSQEDKDGYAALVVGYETARSAEYNGEKHYKLNKPKLGLFTKNGVEPKRIVREIRVKEEELDQYEVGSDIDVSLFHAGERVDAIGTSKGSGFTGVMKRHNFHGTKRSHGVHECYRHGGSIGSSATPARVVKGRKMAGQHGNERVTIQNLLIHSVIAEDNLILIKGNVPGHNGALVMLQDAAKLRRRPRKIAQK